MTKGHNGKKVSRRSVIGQQGVNLVERRVLDMGCLWHPTLGVFDAGIDGYIELRDRETGEALNAIIQVQCKATATRFTAETDTSFTWICDERDLTYWLQGNATVVLVISRPSTDEAYWIPVKQYFSDPLRLKARKILFDKSGDRFDSSTRDRLLGLALPRDAGVYFTPAPRRERLYSNLLHASVLPQTLYVGTPLVRSRWDFVRQARESGVAFEWRYGSNQVISVHDLRSPEWAALVDPGTVEPIPASEWSAANDERRDHFVELLNRCLSARARQIGLHRDRNEQYYYYPATADLSPRTISYSSLKRGSERIVFQRYAIKKPDQGAREYYRHSAFYGRFRRYDEAWYLEITPEYHFTRDGHFRLKFPGSKRKGIKALEKNPTVLGQVVMWADLLCGEQRGPNLFPAVSYPHLTFGELASFELDVGINEQAWLAGAEMDDPAVAAEMSDLPLFLGHDTATS